MDKVERAAVDHIIGGGDIQLLRLGFGPVGNFPPSSGRWAPAALQSPGFRGPDVRKHRWYRCCNGGVPRQPFLHNAADLRGIAVLSLLKEGNIPQLRIEQGKKQKTKVALHKNTVGISGKRKPTV